MPKAPKEPVVIQTFALPASLVERLRQISAETGVSKIELIRAALQAAYPATPATGTVRRKLAAKRP